MGTLENAKPAIIICTRDRARATAFYRDTLGLNLAYEDNLAAVFALGDATLRISSLPDWTPHAHTILGFRVPNVPAAVRELTGRGVTFQRYGHVPQDALGICTLPGGSTRVAWFKDTDGNVLSVTDA